MTSIKERNVSEEKQVVAHEVPAEIVAAREEVRRAETEYLGCKEEATASKKRYEASVDRLNATIDRLTNPQRSLFDEQDPPEPWRAVTVEELGLPASLCETLREAKVCTLGDISDIGNRNELLTDIQGVGEKKAEQIEAACTAYWAAHPEHYETFAPKDDPAEEGGSA